MTRIKHKFIDHQIDPNTETLIIGTFNPEIEGNKAEFFYGRSKNYLWTLVPIALGYDNLKGNTKHEKIAFIKKHKIDFIDLISEIEVQDNEKLNYTDTLIDGKVTEWTKIIEEISNLKHLKRIGFTRRTFSSVPNIQQKIGEVIQHADRKGIIFRFLTTPARFYNQQKQEEWSHFFK
jgi:G:T/U-mismatch repair DNA glycosylase